MLELPWDVWGNIMSSMSLFQRLKLCISFDKHLLCDDLLQCVLSHPTPLSKCIDVCEKASRRKLHEHKQDFLQSVLLHAAKNEPFLTPSNAVKIITICNIRGIDVVMHRPDRASFLCSRWADCLFAQCSDNMVMMAQTLGLIAPYMPRKLLRNMTVHSRMETVARMIVRARGCSDKDIRIHSLSTSSSLISARHKYKKGFWREKLADLDGDVCMKAFKSVSEGHSAVDTIYNMLLASPDPVELFKSLDIFWQCDVLPRDRIQVLMWLKITHNYHVGRLFEKVCKNPDMVLVLPLFGCLNDVISIWNNNAPCELIRNQNVVDIPFSLHSHEMRFKMGMLLAQGCTCCCTLHVQCKSRLRWLLWTKESFRFAFQQNRLHELIKMCEKWTLSRTSIYTMLCASIGFEDTKLIELEDKRLDVDKYFTIRMRSHDEFDMQETINFLFNNQTEQQNMTKHDIICCAVRSMLVENATSFFAWMKNVICLEVILDVGVDHFCRNAAFKYVLDIDNEAFYDHLFVAIGEALDGSEENLEELCQKMNGDGVDDSWWVTLQWDCLDRNWVDGVRMCESWCPGCLKKTSVYVDSMTLMEMSVNMVKLLWCEMADQSGLSDKPPSRVEQWKELIQDVYDRFILTGCCKELIDVHLRTQEPFPEEEILNVYASVARFSEKPEMIYVLTRLIKAQLGNKFDCRRVLNHLVTRKWLWDQVMAVFAAVPDLEKQVAEEWLRNNESFVGNIGRVCARFQKHFGDVADCS